MEPNKGWDIDYESLSKYFGSKKVLTQETYQESSSALMPLDGLQESELEIFQYYGNMKQEESLPKNNPSQRDKEEYKAKKALLSPKDNLTVKIQARKRSRSRNPLDKLKKRLNKPSK